MPASAPLLDHLNEPWSSKGGCGLYNLVAITAYRLQKVESSLSWLRQLIELADKFPATDHIGIESMGFLPAWKSPVLWSESISAPKLTGSS